MLLIFAFIFNVEASSDENILNLKCFNNGFEVFFLSVVFIFSILIYFGIIQIIRENVSFLTEHILKRYEEQFWIELVIWNFMLLLKNVCLKKLFYYSIFYCTIKILTLIGCGLFETILEYLFTNYPGKMLLLIFIAIISFIETNYLYDKYPRFETLFIIDYSIVFGCITLIIYIIYSIMIYMFIPLIKYLFTYHLKKTLFVIVDCLISLLLTFENYSDYHIKDIFSFIVIEIKIFFIVTIFLLITYLIVMKKLIPFIIYITSSRNQIIILEQLEMNYGIQTNWHGLLLDRIEHDHQD